MLIDLSRQKLFNAIAYFVDNTKWCYKTKLFKLLFLLDFQHYQETGRSVTGLHYNAWPMGPVPVSLFDEIKSKQTDLAQRFTMQEKKHGKGNALTIIPQFSFDPALFSRRELRIMESLTQEFHTASADRMVEKTHLENQPWHTVYQQWGKQQALIPYALAIRESEKQEMGNLIQDRNEFLAEFGSRK
ncbi:MAG: SocA family protein [Magnetococcales bacterium]|nr:SocA family protein [Magnetococcales bacterium]